MRERGEARERGWRERARERERGRQREREREREGGGEERKRELITQSGITEPKSQIQHGSIFT